MTDQSTGNNGDTDQSTGTDIHLYADSPQRAIEVKQNRRRRLLEHAWMAFGFVTMLVGCSLITTYIPEPLKWYALGLWTISTFAYNMSGFNAVKYANTRSDHNWQDTLDQLAIKLTSSLDEIHAKARSNMSAMQSLEAKEQAYYLETKNEIERIRIETMQGRESARRGPGRPEITPEEASRWIDKADKAVAELLVKNGRRPTREAIAQASHMTVSTLGRYEKIAGRKVSVNK